ncbi:MAG: hypothetical protein ACOCZA_11320 [Spirochaetota bacterium]
MCRFCIRPGWDFYQSLPAAMGEGVRVVSAEPLPESEQSFGYTALFEFDGRIRDSNAKYRDGNTVTLVDMDMGKIVDNDELFEAVINEGDLQNEEMTARLEEAGIQVESQESIFVRFR